MPDHGRPYLSEERAPAASVRSSLNTCFSRRKPAPSDASASAFLSPSEQGVWASRRMVSAPRWLAVAASRTQDLPSLAGSEKSARVRSGLTPRRESIRVHLRARRSARSPTRFLTCWASGVVRPAARHCSVENTRPLSRKAGFHLLSFDEERPVVETGLRPSRAQGEALWHHNRTEQNRTEPVRGGSSL